MCLKTGALKTESKVVNKQMKKRIVSVIFACMTLLASLTYAETANLLKDSGFEDSSWPLPSAPWTDWGSGEQGGVAGFQAPDGIQHFGNKSAGKMLYGTGIRWGGYSQSVAIKEGDTITASGWLMSTSSGGYTPLSDGAEAFIKLEFFDNLDNSLASCESAPITSASPWVKHAITYSAPPGAVKATFGFILIGEDASTGTAFFDDAFLGVSKSVIVPPVKIISPQNGAMIKSGIIPVVGTVANPSVSSITLNGVTVPCWEGRWETTANLTSGTNQLTATVNGIHHDIVSVEYNPSAPTSLFDVTYPANGAVFYETPALVTAILSNPSDLYININGKEYLAKDGVLIARVPIKVGANTLVLKCRSKSGTEETKSINVTFDASDADISGLIVNSSFENSIYPQKDWTRWNGNVSFSPDDGSASYITTAHARTGEQSSGQVLYGRYARWGGISQEFPVTPGDTVNASGWVASFSSDNPPTGNAEAFLQIAYSSNRNNIIEIYKSGKITGVTDRWIELSVSSVVPYGAETATLSLVQVDLDNNTGMVYFDDAHVDIVPGTPPAPPSLPFNKPQSTGWVKIDGNKILVNNQQFKIKGITYQPVPIGSEIYPLDIYKIPQIYNRDLPLLRTMGVTTIRTYSKDISTGFLDACYNGGVDPIYVIMGFYIDGKRDLSDPAERDDIKNEFLNYVHTYKDQLAVLMWSPGNEVELAYEGSDRYYYTLLNELAEVAYNEEKPAYHPVTAVLANIYQIGDKGLLTMDDNMDYLDVWGANVYEGITFSDMFDDFAHRSKKPFWISEYGVDAYHTDSWTFDGSSYGVTAGYLDEKNQSEWDVNLTVEILASEIASGGTLMAYSDEWWKAYGLSSHDAGGVPQDIRYPQDVLPDRFMNEEYWGIVSISPHPGAIDDVTPRQAYYKLKEVFNSVPFDVVRPGESIKAAVDDAASKSVIYVEKGVYTEGLIKMNGKTLISVAGAPDTVINGRLFCDEAGGKVNGFQIVYSNGEYINFVSTEYPDGLQIMNDAGVTIINANSDVKNCIIKPDLDSMSPKPVNYGKGIQVWNLYNRAYIAPNIANNFIQDADVGIFLFSQAMGGEIWGEIQNNTLDSNKYGIVERMRKENPIIRNNIITSAGDAIHLSYQNGYLLDARLGNIMNNDFYRNTNDVWCDETQLQATPTGGGNIFEDPSYSNPPVDYSPDNLNCADKGCRLW